MKEFGISKAKIKEPKNKWHEYLTGKQLIVGELGGSYNLLGFDGTEEEYKELCKIAWENEPEEEHQYDTLESFTAEVLEGNDGFGFTADEIELIEIKKKG